MLLSDKLREQMVNAGKITEEQEILLDKLSDIHQFFQGLEVACDAAGDVR